MRRTPMLQSVQPWALPDGFLVVPFHAQYYRTTGTFRIGTVAGKADFTMTYQ